jgi:hypothetical protein
VVSDYYWRVRLRARGSARSRGSRAVSTHGLNTQRLSAVQKMWSSYVRATILLQHGPAAWDLSKWNAFVEKVMSKHCKLGQVGGMADLADPRSGKHSIPGTNQGGCVLHASRDSSVPAKVRLCWPNVQKIDGLSPLLGPKELNCLFSCIGGRRTNFGASSLHFYFLICFLAGQLWRQRVGRSGLCFFLINPESQ